VIDSKKTISRVMYLQFPTRVCFTFLVKKVSSTLFFFFLVCFRIKNEKSFMNKNITMSMTKKSKGSKTKHKKNNSAPRKKVILKRLLISLTISLIVLIVGLHLIVSSFLGVSLKTLAEDTLLVIGVTGPTVEEIKELPVEQLNDNVNEFIKAFNEAGDVPEPIGLEEGIQGLRVLDGDDVVLEGTFEVRNGEVISVDYAGIKPGISEEDTVEMSEEMFRIVFGGTIPESFEGVLEAYSKSRGGN